jgi:dephospho-CoA kinase
MQIKIIGLTGGIGSGKTTVAKVFESFGVPIYIADVEAKRIMKNEAVLLAIQNKFGAEAVSKDAVNSALLAQIVFNNPDKLRELNEIVHPAVAEDFKKWISKQENTSFVIKESAILFEIGGHTDCYKTILVTAPQETRIRRVMARDQTDEAQVLQRMKNQWDDARKEKLADFTIINTDGCDLFNEVQIIIKKLNNL